MPSTAQFESARPNPDLAEVTDISPEELAEKTALVRLIDVRQPDEFTGELGHIHGSELFVLGTLPERMHELPKDQTIVFVCRSGGRSARAAALARDLGFQDVYNMQGGMLRWNALQLPTEGQS